MAKNILIFLDGTRNKPSDARMQRDSNVWKMYRLYRSFSDKDPDIIAKYIRGVGTVRSEAVASRADDLRVLQAMHWEPTNPLKKAGKFVFGVPRWLALNVGASAVGWGVLDRIVEAYRFVSTHYTPGDRVFIFGFSRGAYEARSLANFIDRVGSEFRSKASGRDPRQIIVRAYKIFRRGDDESGPALRRFAGKPSIGASPGARTIATPATSIDIHFVGVWDTVASLAFVGEPRPDEENPISKVRKVMPGQPLRSVKTFLKKMAPTNTARDLSHRIPHGRHALAAHELRRPFEPMLWDCTGNQRQTIKQMWFAGAHADIGGGYVDSRLSDLALRWMIQEAVSASGASGASGELKTLPRGAPIKVSTAPLPLHHEIQGWFILHRPTPRAALQFPALLDSAILDSCDVHWSLMRRSVLLRDECHGTYPMSDRSLPWKKHYPDRVAAPMRSINDLLLEFHLVAWLSRTGKAGGAEADGGRSRALVGRWNAVKRRIRELRWAEHVIEQTWRYDTDHDITLAGAMAMLMAFDHDDPCERVVERLIARKPVLVVKGMDPGDSHLSLKDYMKDLRGLPAQVPARRRALAESYIERLERALVESRQ